MTDIVIVDYGSGNVRSAQRALERVGARVDVTSDQQRALECDALVLPGVGALAACMAGIRRVGADRVIDQRLAGGRPVLGICVGMQVMFDSGDEHGTHTECLGQWPGLVQQLDASVLPHMGWDTVDAPQTSRLFAGVSQERFYFVHSYAARTWAMAPDAHRRIDVTHCAYGGGFVAAVEDAALCATQFHPEKSGDAGMTLLENWLQMVRD